MKDKWEERKRRDEYNHARQLQTERNSQNIIKREQIVLNQDNQKLQELQELQKSQELTAAKEEINRRIEETLRQMREKEGEVPRLVEEQIKLKEEEKRRLEKLAIQIAKQQSKQSRVDMAKAEVKEQEDDELDR